MQTTNLQNLSLDNLTDKERKAALSILSAVDYDFYAEYVHRGIYQHGAHTKYLASRLQELERGKIKRLMVFMPPRHSKSMTISETFPSWFLGRNPSKKVIVTSYGEGLARRFGRSNRKKIQEFGSDIFGIRLDPESTVVTKWNIDHHNGQMISTGIGGPISGEGADLLIIDDPIKNRQEADSPRYREMIWDEWQNTLLTRLQPGGLVIIVLTRWHEDDLAGRLLQEEPEKWEVISLPALAEENDLLGRDQNEPLWPEYGFDYNWAIDRKKSVGSFVWAALFQQRPAPSGGGIFKEHWWKFWQYPGQNLPPVTMKDENGKPILIYPVDLPVRFDQQVQSWDMAFKDSRESSFVTGQAWGRLKSDKFLIDQERDKYDFIGTIEAVRSFSKKHPHTRAKWVEDKANGPAIISTLKKEIAGLIPVTPEGGKESRAHAISPYVESGNVFLPHPAIAPWVWEFISECKSFPSGKNNDQVDAMSQALLKMSARSRSTGEGIATVSDTYSKGANIW